MFIIDAVVWFVLLILLIGGAYALVNWAVGLSGLPLPENVIKIVFAIIGVFALLWFMHALMGGAGGLPKLV